MKIRLELLLQHFYLLQTKEGILHFGFYFCFTHIAVRLSCLSVT